MLQKLILFIFSLSLAKMASCLPVLPYLTKERKYRFVDKDVKFVNDKIYDRVVEHTQANYWIATRKGSYILIDSMGKEIFITSGKIDMVYNYNDDKIPYALLKDSGKYGLLQIRSGSKIPAVYDELYPHNGGLLSVKKDGLWGIINIHNETIIPFSKKRVLLFNDTLVIDELKRIINLKTKETYDINTGAPVVSITKSRHFIEYTTKSKTFLQPIVSISDSSKMLEVDKFVLWKDSLCLVVKGGECFVIDSTGNPRFKIPNKLHFSTVYAGTILLLKNDHITYVVDTKGHFDSLNMDMDYMSGMSDSVVYRKDTTKRMWYFLHSKLVEKPVENRQFFKSFSVRQTGYQAEIFDDQNNKISTIDGIKYFEKINDDLVEFRYVKDPEMRMIYSGPENKLFSLPGGFIFTRTIGNENYLFRRIKKTVTIFNSSLKEVSRFDDVNNIYPFARFIVVSDYKDSLRLVDTRNWKPLPYVLKESLTVFSDDSGYGMIMEADKYYINGNGVVLKEAS